MPTPPMLRSRQTAADAGSSGPDPLVAVNVAVMAVVGAGLFIAGVLAVYDYSTPGAEAPLVLWLALVTSGLLLVDVAVMAARHLRRLRLGL